MSKNILVIGEHKDGKIKKSVLGILTKAKEFGNISVVLMGKDLADNEEILGKFGANTVYLCQGPGLENYNPEACVGPIKDLIGEVKPDYIFALATSMGKDLMPRLAARLDTGLASDCVDMALDNQNLVFKRPIYAGKAFVEMTIKNEPALATFRPNVLEINEQEKTSKVEIVNKEININPENLSHKLVEMMEGKSDKPDLTEAEIIVSGGRGVKNKEGFELLGGLVDAFGPGAVMGASRAMVDAEVVPHSIQVGQTGKTVNPKLYIACGISGAIQHLAGMKTSKIIVAINKDPDAPIFEIADYGIVGDLYEIVPQLIEEIEKLKTE